MKFDLMLVFIIPVKNEEQNISKLIKKIFLINNFKKVSVIFIDDKSTDLTVDIIKREINYNKNIHLLERNPRKFFNQRGSALMDGIKFSEANNLISFE